MASKPLTHKPNAFLSPMTMEEINQPIANAMHCLANLDALLTAIADKANQIVVDIAERSDGIARVKSEIEKLIPLIWIADEERSRALQHIDADETVVWSHIVRPAAV